jgi:hypothetical protein
MSASAIPSAPITFAVPFRIGEMNVGPDEVVDSEVVFAVVEAGTASDDLLELDHRSDWTHQDDIADVAGIDASGELLRGGQDGRDGLFVVLKVAENLTRKNSPHCCD